MKNGHRTAWDIALAAFHSLPNIERVQVVYQEGDPAPMTLVVHNRGMCLLIAEVFLFGDTPAGYTWTMYESEWNETGKDEIIDLGGDSDMSSLACLIQTFSEK